jgi:hypothetical protein
MIYNNIGVIDTNGTTETAIHGTRQKKLSGLLQRRFLSTIKQHSSFKIQKKSTSSFEN